METPYSDVNEFEQRNVKAIDLFVDGVMLINRDVFDNELAQIENVGTTILDEQETSLNGDTSIRACDTLVEYGFRRPINIGIYWQSIAENTHEKDGFIETDPREELVSIVLAYDVATVEFTIVVTDGIAEVTLEKEISIEEENFDSSATSEKYSGIFSSNRKLNQSLFKTLLANKINHDDVSEMLEVTDTELEGLAAMMRAAREA